MTARLATETRAKRALWAIGFLAAAAVVALLSACQAPSAPPPEISLQNLDQSMIELVGRSRSNVLAAMTSAAAWGRLGEVYHTLEFLPEARVCYERAAALAPESAQWPHLLGLIRLQDDPETAIGLLKRAAALAGTHPDSPHVRLLQALVERGRAGEAARVAKELLAVAPDHPVARLELARMQLASQELAAAAENLDGCVSNRFTRRAALLLLGQVRQRQGDGAAAAELIRQGTALERSLDWPDPFLAEVQSLRVDRHQIADQVNTFLIRGRLAEAASGLSRLLSAAPDDAEGLLLLGRLRYLEKRCPEAEAALRRHLQVQPDSLNGHMQLALALLCQKRWADAVASLRRVLQLKPELAPAHSNLGYALARSGDSPGAIRSYQEALRYSPGDVDAHFALAEELGIAGRKAEALEELDRTLVLAPADARGAKLRERLTR